MLELIAQFTAGRGGVMQEEAAAWAADLRSLGERYSFSRNPYQVLART